MENLASSQPGVTEIITCGTRNNFFRQCKQLYGGVLTEVAVGRGSYDVTQTKLLRKYCSRSVLLKK